MKQGQRGALAGTPNEDIQLLTLQLQVSLLLAQLLVQVKEVFILAVILQRLGE